jgi:hypothetical protein
MFPPGLSKKIEDPKFQDGPASKGITNVFRKNPNVRP